MCNFKSQNDEHEWEGHLLFKEKNGKIRKYGYWKCRQCGKTSLAGGLTT